MDDSFIKSIVLNYQDVVHHYKNETRSETEYTVILTDCRESTSIHHFYKNYGMALEFAKEKQVFVNKEIKRQFRGYSPDYYKDAFIEIDDRTKEI